MKIKTYIWRGKIIVDIVKPMSKDVVFIKILSLIPGDFYKLEDYGYYKGGIFTAYKPNLKEYKEIDYFELFK